MDELDFNKLYENFENFDSNQLKKCTNCLENNVETKNNIIDKLSKKYSSSKVLDILYMLDQIGGQDDEESESGGESCDDVRKELGEVRDQLSKANSELPSKRRALQKVIRKNQNTEKRINQKLATTKQLEAKMRTRGLNNAKQLKSLKLKKERTLERMKKLEKKIAQLKETTLKTKQAKSENVKTLQDLKQERSGLRAERKALKADRVQIKSARLALKRQEAQLKKIDQMNKQKQSDLISQEKTLKALIANNTKTRGDLTKQKGRLVVREKKLADKTKIFKQTANELNTKLGESAGQYKSSVTSSSSAIEKGTEDLISQIASHLQGLEKISK